MNAAKERPVRRDSATLHATPDASLDATPDATPDRYETLGSPDLFEGARQVFIRHEGVTYLLRITSQNKLILTK